MRVLQIVATLTFTSLANVAYAQSWAEEAAFESHYRYPITAYSISSSSGMTRKLLLRAAENAAPSEPTFESLPSELQFSCAVFHHVDEQDWGRLLKEGDESDRIVTARVLWLRRSRRFSRAVIESLERAEGDDAIRLRAAINDDLRPTHIKHLLANEDYAWGFWLAYLRSDEEMVPVLLEALEDKKDYASEIVLGLGNSRDRRAFNPLLRALHGDDGRLAGDAAMALGRLGIREAEPHLLIAVEQDSPWVQVKAARALGLIGSKASLPVLEKLAISKKYTGALSVRDAASEAIKDIEAREQPERD